MIQQCAAREVGALVPWHPPRAPPSRAAKPRCGVGPHHSLIFGLMPRRPRRQRAPPPNDPFRRPPGANEFIFPTLLAGSAPRTRRRARARAAAGAGLRPPLCPVHLALGVQGLLPGGFFLLTDSPGGSLLDAPPKTTSAGGPQIARARAAPCARARTAAAAAAFTVPAHARAAGPGRGPRPPGRGRSVLDCLLRAWTALGFSPRLDCSGRAPRLVGLL